jgi:hypothetical protein
MVVVAGADHQELNPDAGRGVGLELPLEQLEAFVQLVDGVAAHGARAVEHEHAGGALAVVLDQLHVGSSPSPRGHFGLA